MNLTKEQKNTLARIQAPFIDKDGLNEDELAELCDFITDYVLDKETANDEVSEFGAQLLNVHDDIAQ